MVLQKDDIQSKEKRAVDGFLDSTEEELICTLEDMWADAGPGDLYEGPAAFTARQLAENRPGTHLETARKMAQRMVRQGKWVQVRVRSDVPGHWVLNAWVKREIYEEWMRQHGSINGE